MLSPWFQIVADNFLLDWWKRVDDGTLAEAADMATIHKLQLKKERSTTSYTAPGYAYNFLGWFLVMWASGSWNKDTLLGQEHGDMKGVSML